MNSFEDPIQVEQLINAPVHDVWEALTNLNQMKTWYFPMIPSFNAEVGFKTDFTVTIEDRVFQHIWEIIEVLPQEKLAYQWTFGGYSGKGISVFELIKQEEQTLVKFTFVTLEPFPQHIPEFKRESGEKGWNYFIKEALVNYFSK